MATREEIIKIDETTEMLFKNEEAKEQWEKMVKKHSKDFFSMGVVVYARRWAKYMQTLIAEGKSVSQIAEEASLDADIEGITGFMHTCALHALCDTWKYGDELCEWYECNELC